MKDGASEARIPAIKDVLIVVPTLDEAEHIEGVVTMLLAGAPASATLSVADGGSTDGTRDKIHRLAERDPRVRLVDNPGRIQSAGVNEAARRAPAGAGFLLRADAHAIYPRDFCRDLLDEITRTGAAAVTVGMKSKAAQGFQAGVAAAQNSRLGTGGAVHRMGRGGRFVDHGHHALMCLDAFRALGGYDESMSHNEDADFDHRLRQAGGRIWLAEAPVICYLPRRNAAALFRQYRSYGSGRATMLLKHRLRPRLRQVLPLATGPAAGLATLGIALASLDARWLLLGAPGALWAAACLGYGFVLAIRARSPAVAWSGPAAIVMHLAWSIGFFLRLVRGR